MGKLCSYNLLFFEWVALKSSLETVLKIWTEILMWAPLANSSAVVEYKKWQCLKLLVMLLLITIKKPSKVRISAEVTLTYLCGRCTRGNKPLRHVAVTNFVVWTNCDYSMSGKLKLVWFSAIYRGYKSWSEISCSYCVYVTRCDCLQVCSTESNLIAFCVERVHVWCYSYSIRNQNVRIYYPKTIKDIKMSL